MPMSKKTYEMVVPQMTFHTICVEAETLAEAIETAVIKQDFEVLGSVGDAIDWWQFARDLIEDVTPITEVLPDGTETSLWKTKEILGLDASYDYEEHIGDFLQIGFKALEGVADEWH